MCGWNMGKNLQTEKRNYVNKTITLISTENGDITEPTLLLDAQAEYNKNLYTGKIDNTSKESEKIFLKDENGVKQIRHFVTNHCPRQNCYKVLKTWQTVKRLGQMVCLSNFISSSGKIYVVLCTEVSAMGLELVHCQLSQKQGVIT